MGEKSKDILAQIYARHLTTINQINFTYREIEIIACLLHIKGIKGIAQQLSISTKKIAPKTVEGHLSKIYIKINCNSQSGIIKFIEKSGKLEIIREFYNNIIRPVDSSTDTEIEPLPRDDTPIDVLPQPPVKPKTPIGSLIKTLKSLVAWIQLQFSKKSYLFLCLTVLVSLCLLITIPYHYYRSGEDLSVRADLIVPMNAVLLERSNLMNQIHKKFNNKHGIQSLALIGPGGAGKTITAREYARQQHASVIWEINAENRRSLYNSFENLASALAKKSEDKQELMQIHETKDEHKREGKLIQFVKNHLRALPHWLLIFDNVEQCANILNYFPQDVNTWGEGKIILTTQDKNIENNSQINHAILIRELDPSQKLNLFTKILSQGMTHPLTNTQLEEAQQFLANIPSFPLDVSSAAYYLKSHHISYEKYLENLENYHQDFANMQENLLKEAGSYVKTRYGIITLSLEQLLKSHQGFADLLIFVSLLDSQDIPSSLLKTYKNDTIVDNFMYHLKKYSLIANDSPMSKATFSIHRSTQDIIHTYLSDSLKLSQESSVLKSIAYALDDYLDQVIEREDFGNMQIMANHLEKILMHSSLLTDFSKGILESKLGSIYYFINDDKAKQMLTRSLKKLISKPLTSKDNLKIARSLLQIGIIYTELRHDKEAEEALEKAVQIYSNVGETNYADLAWSLSCLGNIYRKLGNYEKARVYLEKSVSLHEQYKCDNKRLARTLAHLGHVYRGLLGLHQKAIGSLEKSLVLYNKNCPNDHYRIGRVLTELGNLYRTSGDKKAKEYFEKALIVLKKRLSEDHITIGYTLAYLGNCYKDLGEYEKSVHCLEKSLKIHQKHFDENHLTMGWILIHLARAYKARGDIQQAQKLFDRVLQIYNPYGDGKNIESARLLREIAEIYLEKNRFGEAENFIKKSLNILLPRNHLDIYKSLETLGEVYLKQASRAQAAESQHLKSKALEAFNQALQIIEKDFPKNSVHVERINFKIKMTQK